MGEEAGTRAAAADPMAPAAEAAQEAEETAPPVDAEAQVERLDLRKALVRKVAQLTKVVVHLNARNDEAELRYERLRASFEEEIQTITQDAALKLAAERSKLQELMDVTAFRAEVARTVEAWKPQREAARAELQAVRQDAATRRDRLVELAQSRLRKGTEELRGLARQVRASLEAFREVAGRSRAELEQRDTDLREQRAGELRAVATEHKRRLDDLRAAQARELEHLRAAGEQARTHLQRMHDSELSTLRMQALQKRREKVHRLEQDFGEERRTLEQVALQMGFELEQQRQDLADAKVSCTTIQQQVDAMRATLDEMARRVEQSEVDVAQGRAEAAEKEAQVAQLQSEVAVLQVRQRAAGLGDAPAPPLAGVVPNAAAAAAAQAAAAAALAEAPERRAAAELSAELRDAIVNTKYLEAELGQLDAEFASLDEDLTEKEKEVEILEVEIEEEQLRTHKMQVQVLGREAAFKAA